MRARAHESVPLAPLFATAVVSLFALEVYRLFFSGLVFGIGGDSPIVLGVIGLAIAGLALINVVLVGSVSRARILILVGALIVFRLLAQYVRAPMALFAVGAAAVVVVGLLVPTIALVHGGSVVGAGLVLGGALDIAIMAGRHTLDLTRSSTFAAGLLVVALAAIAIGGFVGEDRFALPPRSGTSTAAGAVFAIGPWMAVHLTVTGNLGFIGAVSGLGLAASTAVAGLAVVVALAWVTPRQAAPPPVIAAGVVVAGLWLLGSTTGPAAGFLVAVIGVAAGAAITTGFEREATAPRDRAAWAGGAGMMAGFAATAIAYAPFAGFPLPRSMVLVLVGLPVLAGAIACLPARPIGSARTAVPAVVSAAVLIGPIIFAVLNQPTQVVQLREDPFILSYNINHGFSAEGELALESMARVIESSEPDIVALQEVPRGWVATGGVDVVAWLQQRLGIPVLFSAGADAQWGVALATSLPTDAPMATPLGPEYEDEIGRVALDVPITVRPGFELRAIVMQLHQDVENDEVRQEQMDDLLVAWGGFAGTAVIGDFAAAPLDDINMQLFEAGLVEAGRYMDTSSATWPADDPTVAADQIWVTADLAITVARVVPLEASDHRAVLARVSNAVIPPE